MDNPFTHLDGAGRARMADISEKDGTRRTAAAGGRIRMSRAALERIAGGTAPKGDVLAAARIAGIMAAKRTWELIPLCHPAGLESCTVDFRILTETDELEACCTARCTGKTGVEMEALTGVTVSLLTIYDMCKAIDRGMEIHSVALWTKTGGKSGDYAGRAEKLRSRGGAAEG